MKKTKPIQDRFNEFSLNNKMIEVILVIFIFLFNLFLVVENLQPDLLEINPHDGAKYVESGRLLIVWGLRNLAWGPLVAFIYAPIHLIVGNLPNWFMLEAWIGNYIFFALLWFSFYALAKEIDKYISKLVMIGLLFASTVFFPIIENQSDALFVALSAIALQFLVRFAKERRIKNLWFSSIFVGFGILSRVETVLLLIPLVFISIVISRKRHRLLKVIFACVLPVATIFGLFIVANMINFGHPNLGMGNKSYESFQMNQAFLPGSKNQEAYARGEPIFGTEEENNKSIIRAILRNPIATGERALANLLRVPEMFLNFFGKTQGPILLIFSILGLIVLIKYKEWLLLLIILVWPLHAFISLIFLSRHIIPQVSYVFFIIPAIGITYLLSVRSKRIEWMLLLVVSMGLTIWGAVDSKPAFLSAGILLFLVSIAGFLNKLGDSDGLHHMPGMLFLIGLIIFGHGFTFPSKVIGQSRDEVGAHKLQEAVPVGSNVLSSYHTIAIAAKTTSYLLPSDINTTEDLLDFLNEKNIVAIYVDDNMPYQSDVVVETIETYSHEYDLFYQSENGGIRIYLKQ